jgi:hypothetical protein
MITPSRTYGKGYNPPSPRSMIRRSSLRTWALLLLAVSLPLSSILLSFYKLHEDETTPVSDTLASFVQGSNRSRTKELILNSTESVSRSEKLHVVEVEPSLKAAKGSHKDQAEEETIQNPTTSPKDEQLPRERNESQFVTDALCPGCRYEPANLNLRRDNLRSDTCQTKIQDMLAADQNMSLAQAGADVALKLKKDGACIHCDPSSCSEQAKRYGRLDDMAPKARYATTHFLKAVPSDMRLPVAALGNLTGYFSDPKKCWPSRRYVSEFNPSIVVLPKHQIPQHIDRDKAVYLASYRVSTAHACLGDDPEANFKMIGSKWPAPDITYFGLSILDKDLSILDQTVVEVKTFMFQDPRLFVLGNNDLFFGSYSLIQPLWLVPPTVDVDEGFYKAKTISDPGGGKMEVTIGSKQWRPSDEDMDHHGKNFNYFVDSSNQSVAEYEPMQLKETLDLDVLYEPKKRINRTTIDTGARLPPPSFATVDELYLAQGRLRLSPFTRDRGGACCATITDPQGQNLLLGISHTKVVHFERTKEALTEMGIANNIYFSSFYAMKPFAPYTVVARTGRFCFGFPSKDEMQASGNPYGGMASATFMIGGTFYNCPRIHFVSGIVDKADDATKLIVAYGVNDCFSRFLVIEKSEVVRILFPGSYNETNV